MGEDTKKTRVPAKLFVQVWQQAANLDEVCEKTGLRRISAQTRARVYRTKGVALKKFRRQGISKTDYTALATLAEQTAPKEAVVA